MIVNGKEEQVPKQDMEVVDIRKTKSLFLQELSGASTLVLKTKRMAKKSTHGSTHNYSSFWNVGNKWLQANPVL